MGVGVIEAIARREERGGDRRARVGGPGEGQAAGEVARAFPVLAGDQHIGDALPLRPRQPGRDEGVGGVQFGAGEERPAREEDHDRRNALAFQAFEQRNRVRAVTEEEVFGVPLKFGIGLFAKEEDGDIGLLLDGAGGVDPGGAARSGDGVHDRAADGLAAREISGGRVGPLPGDGPAARLHRHIVGARASDQHPGARLDRQDRPFILEQHERFGDRFAGDGEMIGRTQLGRVAALHR